MYGDSFGPESGAREGFLVGAETPERDGVPRWIAAQIRDLIHRGELNAGDRLPSERVLCEELGVARLTLRAGLKYLRDEGYLDARRGSGGGNYVTELSVPFKRWVERVRSEPKILADITDLRVAVEGHAAALAARRAGPEAQAEMEQALTEIEEEPGLVEFRAADARFHTAVGVASGSARLAAAVAAARGELFIPANALLGSAEAMDASRREHREILDAIAARDPERAAVAMTGHVEHTLAWLIDALDLDDLDALAGAGAKP